MLKSKSGDSAHSQEDRFTRFYRSFTWLGKHGDPHRLDLNQATQEAQQCSDLLSQSTYHEIRARKKDEEEQLVRRKQDEERRKLREKQLQEEVDISES